MHVSCNVCTNPMELAYLCLVGNVMFLYFSFLYYMEISTHADKQSVKRPP